MASYVSMPYVLNAARNAGFKGEDLILAGAIAKAESGLDKNAKSHTDDHGIWQINARYHIGPGKTFPDWTVNDLYKTHKNAEAAYTIYRNAGYSFSPWVAYDNGSYKKFMDQARAGAEELGTYPGVEPVDPEESPGYDGPAQTIREPAERAARQVKLGPDEWIPAFRVINTGQAKADLVKAITGATVKLSNRVASHIAVDFMDTDKRMEVSGLFNESARVILDGVEYGLSRVENNGRGLSTIWEDMAIVDLRELVWEGTYQPESRYDLVRNTVAPLRWINFSLDKSDNKHAEPEWQYGNDADPFTSAWDALSAMAQEWNWRLWAMGNHVFMGSDPWAKALWKTVRVSELNQSQQIDFNWTWERTLMPISDEQKKQERDNFTASIPQIALGRYSLAPGRSVTYTDPGMAKQEWVVTEVTRSLFSRYAAVSLALPETPLPPKTEAQGKSLGEMVPGLPNISSPLSGEQGGQANTVMLRRALHTAFGIPLSKLAMDTSRPDSSSDHGKGLAIDIVMGKIGTPARGSDLALGNRVVQWLKDTKDVWGVTYIIWQDRFYSASRGWGNGVPYPSVRPGRANNPTWRHDDHIHVSVKQGHRVTETLRPPRNISTGPHDGGISEF